MSDARDTPGEDNRFATDWDLVDDGPEPTSITFVALDGPDEDPDFDPSEAP